METAAIHRLIEQHAAIQPDGIAIIDGASTTTYRELNYRANTFARYLISHGLRRGAHAMVDIERGTTRTIALLGILKAGGSYELIEPIDGAPSTPTLVIQPCVVGEPSSRDRVAVPLDDLLAIPTQPSPNLPILTRGSDIACVLRDERGASHILVPHATIVALRQASAASSQGCVDDGGTLGLWLALMSGETVTTVASTRLTPVPAVGTTPGYCAA